MIRGLPGRSWFLLFSVVLICSCTLPEEPGQRIRLEAVHAGVTALTLKISAPGEPLPWSFSLHRDDSTLLTGRVAATDTLLTDYGLEPARVYRYRASLLEDGQVVDESPGLPLATRDTTSHAVVWTVDTLGIWGTRLYDVAVIDEDDIWVVGEIYTDEPDTVHGNPFSVYTAAHWDGTEWEMILVPALTDWGAIARSAIFTIFKVSENELVMFSEAGSYVQWVNGEWYSEYVEARPLYVYAAWGTSLSNLYFVGRDGGITNYDGSTFTLQETGTLLPLHDIYGLDSDRIWASGYTNTLPGSGGVILRYEETAWRTQYSADSVLDSLGYVYGLFVTGDTLYFNTSSGFRREHVITGEGYMITSQNIGLSQYGPTRIRGSGYYDIVCAAGNLNYYHWNGSSWRSILDTWAALGDRFWYADFHVSPDLIVIPGSVSAGGIVFRGIRM